MTFKPGEIKELAVVGIREYNETKYIYLSDGVIETYRVKAFDFQTEWEVNILPKTMKVFVAGINIMNGLPYLQQFHKDVLEHCYTEPGELYPFKVVAIETDEKTQAKFYKLKESFGLTHRYYPKPHEPERNINDLFSLLVSGVDYKEANKAFLKLSYLAEEIEPIVSHKVADEDAISTPKEKSFGNEDSHTEFKSTIVFPPGSDGADIDMQMQTILKIIAGFQNRDGGKLYIGVNDSGTVCGINADYQYLNTSLKDRYTYSSNRDGFELKVRNAVRHSLGKLSNKEIEFEFESENGLDYCCVTINQVLRPVYVDGLKLFQRAGNLTDMLNGDQLTWFIEERMLERNKLTETMLNLAKQENAQQIIEEEDVPVLTESLVNNFPKPMSSEQMLTSPNEDVWFYLSFYKNGDWSYQNDALNCDDEVLRELPIPKSLKKERLLMAYTNGCVNVVSPYDVINPKRPDGKRRYKTKGKRYKNGWNTESEIINIFAASSEDLVSIQSEDRFGDKFIKLHNVSAISVHTGLHLAGNVVVNPNHNVKTTAIDRLPAVYKNSLSSLLFKDYQTSQAIGHNQKERDIQSNLNALRRVLDKKK